VAHLEAKLLLLPCIFQTDLLIVKHEEVDRKDCNGNLIESIEQVIVVLDPREAVLKIEVHQADGVEATLKDVELGVENKIGPELPPVPKHQPPQVLELRDRIVRETGSLVSFFPEDPDPDIGGLDHIDIIGSVPNAESDALAFMLPDKPHDLSLLSRGESKGNGRFGVSDQFIEISGEVS